MSRRLEQFRLSRRRSNILANGSTEDDLGRAAVFQEDQMPAVQLLDA
jgi:hypothetical protein